MKIRNEFANLHTAIARMAEDLANHQVRLTSLTCGLEAAVGAEACAPPLQKVAQLSGNAMPSDEPFVPRAVLTKKIAMLELRNRQSVLLCDMNDLLQSCTSEAEAWSIVARTAEQLFPACSGALFVNCASRNMLEAATVWGALPPARLIFAPDECWAQRRGQPHLALGHGPRCAHASDDARMYVCLPLLAQGETLGILHLQENVIGNTADDAARMHLIAARALVFAAHLARGIAHLRLRESMRNLSIRDPLTGLVNRRYMEEALAQEQYRARRNGLKMAVIMIDIDHFKCFNDQFGHDGGDAVLRALGGFLKEQVRGSDIACRYGGEEFVLLLSPATAEGARLRAETIRVGAAQLAVIHGQRALGPISLSLGVAMFPEHGADAAAIIKAADVALYQAKNGGRDRVVMAPDRVSQGAGAPSA